MPALYAPTASKVLDSETSSPPKWPASIGPPDTMMDGMLSRAAAISMPGTILSQFGMSTRPSN